MIIKIKSIKTKDFGRLVRYIVKDSSYDTFILRHNLKGTVMTDWITEFEDNERKYRTHKRKNATILTHEIMSFAKEDTEHLSLAILKELARRYIDLRGREAIVLATPHFDQDHTHIHFLFSGIKYKSNASIRMSKKQFKKIKQDIQQYQLDQYPELTHSVVWHGKGNQTVVNDKEYRVISRKGESDKQKVKRIVGEIKEMTASAEELYEKLKQHDIIPYTRSGKTVGVIYNKRKYRWRVLGVRVKELSQTKEQKSIEKYR